MNGRLNVDLDKGTCIEERSVDIWSDDSLEAVIAAIRSAAEGLDRVTVEVECDQLVVSGHRRMTQGEILAERSQRDEYARRRAWNAAYPG